jgi:SAM-dependent methyltransferase
VGKALSEVTADSARYTFVDIGCGRGFVLLQALRRRYHRIVGIELAPQIAAEARKNVEAYARRRGLAAGSVEVVAADATTWELPCEPSVLYFANPFSRKIFETMIRRIEESLRRNPRELYVVHAFPESRQVFDDSPSLETVADRKRYVVYRSRAIV